MVRDVAVLLSLERRTILVSDSVFACFFLKEYVWHVDLDEG